jgi:hypothetical protein
VGFYLQPAAGGRILSYALHTGNDDNIVMDLLTPYAFQIKGGRRELRIVGGLLGHWAVWTRKASELLRDGQAIASSAESVSQDLIRRGVEVTDANAAFFDAANHFGWLHSRLA